MAAARLRRSPLLGAVAAAVTLGLTACGGGSTAAAPPPTSSKPDSVTPTPVAPVTPTAPAASTLSGRAMPDGPVVIVKVDNTHFSLPHVGIAAADVIYVEQVEGGQTRLAAVYSTVLPPVVGPVRSARETDAELLPQYGRVAFGFSGSVNAVHNLVRQAGLIDVSGDVGAKGYGRLSGRRAPYNTSVAPAALVERANGSALPKDVGFRFGAVPTGGRPVTTAAAHFPTTTSSFTYDPASGNWLYRLDGRTDDTSNGQSQASTVIVQSVPLTSTGRNDVAGSPVPFAHSVGSGTAVVLRDGQAFDVTWQRSAPDQPTRWLYNGTDFPMKAGQVWVVLLDSTRAVALA